MEKCKAHTLITRHGHPESRDEVSRCKTKGDTAGVGVYHDIKWLPGQSTSDRGKGGNTGH